MIHGVHKTWQIHEVLSSHLRYIKHCKHMIGSLDTEFTSQIHDMVQQIHKFGCYKSIGLELLRCQLPWRCPFNTSRDGTRGCGCGFDENPPVGKPAGLEKTRPQVDLRVHFCSRTRGFRVPAGVTKDIIKMHKSVNLNSQTLHFYK